MPSTRAPDIKVISFDLDDTLWPLADTIATAEKHFFQFLSQRCPKLLAYGNDKLLQHRREFFHNNPHLHHQISQLRIAATAALLSQLGYREADLISEQAFEIFIRQRNAVTPYAATIDVLSTLKKHFRLIAITNGNANLAHSGIGEYFDFCLSAEQLNASKPMAKPFQVALDKTGVAPDQIIHVGDHIDHDIGGAIAQGWYTVWLDHGQTQPSDIHPSAIIHAIDELPDAIGTMIGRAL